MNFSQNARDLEIAESEYRVLLTIFQEHLVTDLTALETALLGSDMQAAYAAAHSIKGASGSLNLWPIYDAASVICTFAKEGTAESARKPLEDIRAESTALARVLANGSGGAADGEAP